MAIIHPLKPRMGAGLVLTVIAIIWVVSVLIAFPNLLYAEIFTFNGTDVTVCYLKWPDAESGGLYEFASVSPYSCTFYLFCKSDVAVAFYPAMMSSTKTLSYIAVGLI